MQTTEKELKIMLNNCLAGKRLDLSEYIDIYDRAEFFDLAFLANEFRKKRHPDSDPVTFVVDRNVNYTNICVCKCKFCAFHRNSDDHDAYVLSYNEIYSKVKELMLAGGTQLLLQGGLNPDISMEYYINLLSSLRKEFPALTIHAFSPPEISFIAAQNRISAGELLVKFKLAGLSSIPGGGAEILCDDIRSKLSPSKISAERWLQIMKIAHNLNIPSTATMMAGSIEAKEHIISHLIKIRDLQDKTNGFKAFIPWSFYSNNTVIKSSKIFTAYDYLKLVAISRIILDNIDNIQASWPTQGINVAQAALFSGANDFGGTMMEENVLSSTGLKIQSSLDKIITAIKATKRLPAQRLTDYTILKTFK